MADGPRISDSLDPRSLVPDERAVVGGALRSGGRQNKESGRSPAAQAIASSPAKTWYRGWPAAATAGVIVVVAASAVAVATNSGRHAKPVAQTVPSSQPGAPSAAPIATAPATSIGGPATSLAGAVPTGPIQWHVVAVVRSIGAPPKRQNPFDQIDTDFDNIHAGQRFEETVSCTPSYCLPPQHTFVVGETFAYWGLAGEGSSLKAASVPRKYGCQGQTFSMQPGYTSTLTKTSATSYTSTLSLRAFVIPTTCGGRPYNWYSAAYVVDRTITQVP